MANLRTNNLSGEQGQKAIRGSLGFHGSENSTDYLTIGSAGDFNYLHDGTSDWTVEFFIRPSKVNDRQTVFSTGGNSSQIGFACRIMEDGASGGSNGYKVLCQFSRGASGNYLGFLGGVIDNKDFSHVALVFTTSNKQLAIYINGQLTNSSDLDGTAEGTFGSGNFSSSNSSYALTIGRENYSTTLYLDSAFLSNLRIVEGETVYTAAFTPPTSELTIIPNTTLLCCQDSMNPTQEATGKTITANGNFADADFLREQSKVIPPFGVDAGNTFGGPIQQSTQGYMYFPTGRTEERGRGRGIIAGGSPGTDNNEQIEFFNIQSDGVVTEFGELITSRRGCGGCSSSTRGLIGGGTASNPSPTFTNSMEFITIATTANGTDFGDLNNASRNIGGFSNQTRGLFAGGGDNPALIDVIDFFTIASTGDATDFGNLTDAKKGISGVGSPTRGLFAGGYNPSHTDDIDLVTIATTGNATDFGNLTLARAFCGGVSSSTRGVWGGGGVPSAKSNVIDFVTIASAGNATDFGDLLDERNPDNSQICSHTRGLFVGGENPGPSACKLVDKITIATTGNATNFGDIRTSTSQSAGCSDSHGGLS